MKNAFKIVRVVRKRKDFFMRPVLIYPSPNFNERRLPIDMIVLHYTGMKSERDALNRLTDPASGVSAHYVVFENGDIYNPVDEELRAWHAGVSFWRGETDTNSRSIGIEIANSGHEFGYRPFPDEQIESVVELCRDIIRRRNIPAGNIVGHSDVAPARKADPGELFPWKTLAKNGVGLWTDEFIPPEKDVTDMLTGIGYDVTDEPAAYTAFARHFYPADLTGKSGRGIQRLAAVSALYERRDAKK